MQIKDIVRGELSEIEIETLLKIVRERVKEDIEASERRKRRWDTRYERWTEEAKFNGVDPAEYIKDMEAACK